MPSTPSQTSSASTQAAAPRIAPSSLFALFGQLEAFVAGSALHLVDIMILLWLSMNGQGSAGDFARGLGLARARVTRCLARLSQSELVIESVDRADRRVLRYRLSSRGENVVFELRKRLGTPRISYVLAGFCALQHAAHDAKGRFGCAEISTSAQRILLLLATSKENLPVKALAQAASLSTSTTSMAVTSLVKRGFAAVHADQIDARQRLVGLSESGKKIGLFLAEALENAAVDSR